MTATTALQFEDSVRKTLDDCILKMAAHLNRGFDPLKKESMSLFRQFCAALRTRVQWVKSVAASAVWPTAKDSSKTNSEEIQESAPLRTVSSFSRDIIDKTLENYPKTFNPLDVGHVPVGLLRKR